MRSAIAALVGFGAAVVLLISASFQAAGPSPTWPPPPKAIVNFLGEEEWGGNSPGIPLGGDLVLYTVPSDRYLVITEIDGPGSLVNNTRLIEVSSGGAVTLKMYPISNRYELNPRDTVGLVFDPGSQVAVRSMTNSGPPYLYANFRWTGYLTR